MMPEIITENDTIKHDEDVKFELEKEPEIPVLKQPDTVNKEVGQTIIPVKEDTLGNSDFPPLTELEKEPKLPTEE